MGKNSNENQKEVEEFKIEVLEHERFDHIVDEKFVTSGEFCKKVSELFRSIYSDYEGCCYEVNQQGLGTIGLFFNHAEITDENRKAAITRIIPEDSGINSDVVRRIRTNDFRSKNGDRYFLTKEGKEGLDDFVIPNMVNYKTGKVQWDKITAEVANGTAYYGQPPVVYTKVSLIDPGKIAALIYGETDEEGEHWVYDVVRLSSMPMVGNIGGNFESQYMLKIRRVYEPEVVKLSNQMGVSLANGINITR